MPALASECRCLAGPNNITCSVTPCNLEVEIPAVATELAQAIIRLHDESRMNQRTIRDIITDLAWSMVIKHYE